MVMAWAATLNLIAATRSKVDAAWVEGTISSLLHLPLAGDDPHRRSGAGCTSSCSPTSRALISSSRRRPAGAPRDRFECVTVDVSTENERQLASIASPLLVPDLPDFLWWAADTMAGGSLFAELVDISDRLIVDSARCLHPATALQELHGFVHPMHDHAALNDFAWARLGPWRRLTTQFFDVPAALPLLELIDEVTLTYSHSPHHWSGFSSALLFAGWLGSRLNWRTPGELLPVRGDPNAWRATLRAGAAGRQREVTVTLRPTAKALAASTLLDLRLAADGGKAGVFTIERLDGNEYSHHQRQPRDADDVAHGFRPLARRCRPVGEELRIFGRDPIFEAALAFAADLSPAGFVE